MTTVADAIYILEEDRRAENAMEIAKRVLMMRNKFANLETQQAVLDEKITAALKVDLVNKDAVGSILRDTREFASDNCLR